MVSNKGGDVMKNWTIKEDKFLEKYYENNTNEQLGLMIDRTPTAVGARAFKLGLKKSKEFMTFHASKTWIKKGNVPWNKGMKGVDLSNGKNNFKKGNVPHNRRPIGSTRVCTYKSGSKYKMVKVSFKKWDLMHRVEWEKYNGVIPEHHVVTFKDGDSLNTHIDNLKCVHINELTQKNLQSKESIKKRVMAVKNWWRRKKL